MPSIACASTLEFRISGIPFKAADKRTARPDQAASSIFLRVIFCTLFTAGTAEKSGSLSFEGAALFKAARLREIDSSDDLNARSVPSHKASRMGSYRSSSGHES